MAKSANGPRARGQIGADDYDNLILVCAEHHKIIDDHPDDYSVELLRSRKSSHEAWVRTRLGNDAAERLPSTLPEGMPLRFVNRRHELDELSRLADESPDDDRPVGPKILILTGMGGVGKSALGAIWAHRNYRQFDGGCLSGNLARRDEGGVDLNDVLGDFLHQLGVSGEELPTMFAHRVRMFRRLTRDRRLLMVLDDVREPAQVMSMLPAGPGSVVLVTSTRYLEELLRVGAYPVAVEPLDRESSIALLAELIGLERVSAEPSAAARLADACAGLPVALCVCAGRLAGRDRRRRLAWLADSIDAEPEATLGLDDRTHALGSIFDFAYRDLPEHASHLYRRLGLHPGSDFSPPDAAALAGTDLATTLRALDVLSDSHLVEPQQDDRYGVHALVRAHMRSCAHRDEPVEQQRVALTRFVERTYAALRVADDAIFADRLRIAPDPPPADNLPVLTSRTDALAWFAAEWATVVAAQRAARDIEEHARVWQIAEALWPFVYNLKLYSVWLESYESGVAAAIRTGDVAAEARMRSALARAFSDQGRISRAADEMRIAVARTAELNNQSLVASIVEFDGIVRFDRGDVGGARDCFESARGLFAAAGVERGVALQNYWLGKCLIRNGGYEAALEPLALARHVMDALDDRVVLGRVIRREGEAHLGAMHFPEARQAFRDALRIAEQVGMKLDQALAIEGLANVADRTASADDAGRLRHRAYRIYEQLGHPRADAFAAPGADVG